MKRVFKERTCEECGNLYMPTGINQKLCSDECRKIKKVREDRIYQEQHREHIAERSKIYRATHKEELEKKAKIRRESKKEDKAKKDIEYRKNNKEKIAQYKRNYYKTEKGKDKKRAGHSKRRALKIGAKTEKIDYKFINERDKFTCQICGKKINFNLKRPDPLSKSYDHIVPLSRGGEDTNRNIQLTHLHCNLSKHNNISSGVQMHLL